MVTGYLPFESTCEIKHSDLPLKVYFSDNFSDLLEKLTRKNPSKRLKDVKNHKFFSNVCFPKVLQKSLKPPFIPSAPMFDTTLLQTDIDDHFYPN